MIFLKVYHSIAIISSHRRTLTISRELGDRAIEAQVTMKDESPPYIILACGT